MLIQDPDLANLGRRLHSVFLQSRSLASRSGNRHGNLVGDSGIEIDVRVWSLNRNEKRVPRGALPPLESGLFFPPSADRKHPDRITLRESRSAAAPDV